MAFTKTIPVGRAFSMVQDVVYGLPSAALNYLLTGTGVDLEISNDGTTWVNVTSTTVIMGKFARIHDAAAVISLYHN